MQYQGNQIPQDYSQNQQYATPMYEKPGDEQHNSNQGAPMQFYEKPQPQNYQHSNDFQAPDQNQNNNYNNIDQPLVNNAYLLNQENGPLNNNNQDNKLTIPFQNGGKNFFIVYMFVTSIITIILAPTFHKIYAIFILLIEFILFLHFLSYKIELTKDFSQRKIIIKKINALSRVREKIAISFESFYFNIRQTEKHYSLIIINSFKEQADIDLNSSNIRNSPAKSIYCFEKINTVVPNKFTGALQLNNVIEDFISNPNKNLENPLNFNINAYKSKFQSYYSQRDFLDFNKYIKFNDYFFSYFNGNPLKNNSFHFNILYGVSIFIHFCCAFPLLMVYSSVDDYGGKDFAAVFLIMYGFFYTSIYFIFYLICKLKMCCKQKSIRIDVIYSRDFDKLFIGVIDMNKNSYINRTEFNISEIDKFVLSKNTAEESGFHLIPMYKGDNNVNNMGKEIAFIKDVPTNLEGLVYILNEKLVVNNNNNFGNTNFNEQTPTSY